LKRPSPSPSSLPLSLLVVIHKRGASHLESGQSERDLAKEGKASPFLISSIKKQNREIRSDQKQALMGNDTLMIYM